MRKFLTALLLLSLLYCPGFSQSFTVSEEQLTIIEMTLNEQQKLIRNYQIELNKANEIIKKQQKSLDKLETQKKIIIPVVVISSLFIGSFTTYKIMEK